MDGSTWGNTPEEALRNIGDVVRMMVDEFIEEGKPCLEGHERQAKPALSTKIRFRIRGIAMVG